jgi:hypothetical protein
LSNRVKISISGVLVSSWTVAMFVSLTRLQYTRAVPPKEHLGPAGESLVRGSWFVVRGSWFVVRGSWFVVLGSWFVVRGSGFVVRGSGF